MKDSNKLIIAIVGVIAIVVAVVGATFAWWTWTSTDAEKTNVGFSVPSGSTQLKAILDADGTAFSGMAPAANCKGTYAKKATIRLYYQNATINPASISATLKLKSITPGHGVAESSLAKNKINWALTSVDAATACVSGGTGYIAGGTLSDKTTNSELYTGNLGVGTIAANTNFGNPNKTLYLYFWIDSSYNGANSGNSSVTDGMQDMSLSVAWSGTITNAS